MGHETNDWLKKIYDVTVALQSDVASMRSDVNSLRAAQESHGKQIGDLQAAMFALNKRFDGVDTEFRIIQTRFDGIDKRLDEQGRYIAALIPQKIAAVGGR